MVLITHDPELAGKCDRILHIQDGLVVKSEDNITSPAGKVAECLLP